MRTFVESRSQDFQTQNGWYASCQGDNVPFVSVEHRRKYSAVNWDCISLQSERESQLASDKENIKQRLLAVFDKFANKKSRYSVSYFSGTLDNLLPEDARMAAGEISAIFAGQAN